MISNDNMVRKVINNALILESQPKTYEESLNICRDLCKLEGYKDESEILKIHAMATKGSNQIFGIEQ